MSQTPKRWSIKGAVFAASLSVVFAACGTAATSPSASSPRVHRPIRRSHRWLRPPQRRSAHPQALGSIALRPPHLRAAQPSRGMSLSEERRCSVRRRAVHRQHEEDHGDRCADRRVPALQPGRLLPAEGRVQRVRHPGFGLPDGARARTARSSPSRTAPGPYKFKEWSKGNRLVWEANPDYWGDKAKTPGLEFHWSDESAARLLDLQSGTVDGIDNPGTPDITTIKADSEPEVLPASRAEHAVPRLQQHAEAVR